MKIIKNMTISALILASILILSSIIIYVSAATSFTGRLPAEFTTLTSTSVNFTAVFNQTNNAATTFNVTIYNSSNPNSNRNYSNLVPNGIIIRNASFWNQSVTMVDGKRIWTFFNVTNGSSTGTPVLTDVRIFDIDTGFLKFKFGGYDKINFTLDIGNADFANNLTANIITLRNQSYLDYVCDGHTEGALVYNVTAKTFLGCNGSQWMRLNEGQ